MKKIITRFFAVILLFAQLILCSCASNSGGKENVTTFPPIVTVGIPEKESVSSELESDGFTVKVYETYAEIVSYDGEATELTVPDSFLGVQVKKIGEYAFYLCEKLEKVTLPKYLIEIDNNAFEECKNLKTVITGDVLEVIGSSAFQNTSLTEISLPDTVYKIERYAFYRTKLTSFTVPANVSSLGKYAFYGCDALTSITLNARLTNINEYVFHNCTALTEIIITGGVTRIGDYCFRGCSSLKKIFVPKGTKLGENVFLSCPELTIYTPKGSYAVKAAKKSGYSYKICSSADKMTGGEG